MPEAIQQAVPQACRALGFAGVLCAALFASTVFAQPPNAQPLTAQPPNVLLIYVDDLGYGDLASYGHPNIKTPHLDRLAREGVRLTNYYAPSALCSPSRAGLLTGRHPYRSGIDSWIPHDSNIYLRTEEVTLAELLKTVGYETALVGKWHLNSNLGNPDEPQPLDQGFDYAYGHNAFQMPTNKNPTNLFRNGEALDLQKGYTADLYAADSIRWLQQRDDQKPFFLMLSMAEPHTSIENPPAWNRRYQQFTTGDIHAIPSGLAKPPKNLLKPRGPGEYYANVSYMDNQIGRVLKTLKKLRLADNTLVVFASDNGAVTSQWLNWWEVNAYGSTAGLRGRKHMIYEGGIKVPAIVRYPGKIRPGSENDQLTVGMDLFTTIANIAGATVPADREIDGQDMGPALFSKASAPVTPQRTLLWALEGQSTPPFALRIGDWKLVLDAKHNISQLFDLSEDPLELFDLAEAEPERASQMRNKFKTEFGKLLSDPLRPAAVIN